MDRRSFIRKAGILAGGAAAGGALAAPALAQAAPVVTWRLASDYPPKLDIIYAGAVELARRVGELTEGRFTIEVGTAVEMFPGGNLIGALGDGTVEMGQTASYNYVGIDPTFAFGTAVPFGLNSRMQNAWMYHGGGLDLLNAFYAGYGFRALVGGNTGAQMGGWYQKAITSVEDFAGLRIRVGGFAGRVLAKLGAEPVALPVSEILPAFQKGEIDAAELIGPYEDEIFQLNTVADTYTYPGFWEGGAMLMFWINTGAWDALPPVYRAALETAAMAVTLDMQARYDVANPPALKRLVAGGTQLHAFPPAVLSAALAAANEVYAEISAENPGFKTIYDAMAAFRAEEYGWMRLTDETFDAFMVGEAEAGRL